MITIHLTQCSDIYDYPPHTAHPVLIKAERHLGFNDILKLADLKPSRDRGACADIQIVSRDEWGALPPKEDPVAIEVPVNMSFVHNTAGNWTCDDLQSCINQVEDIQRFHMFERGQARKASLRTVQLNIDIIQNVLLL